MTKTRLTEWQHLAAEVGEILCAKMSPGTEKATGKPILRLDFQCGLYCIIHGDGGIENMHGEHAW